MFNKHEYKKHKSQHIYCAVTDPYWLSKQRFSSQKLMQTKRGNPSKSLQNPAKPWQKAKQLTSLQS
jgi:hypothetical protein